MDPQGLDCVYFDDSGTFESEIDTQSIPRECGETGGTWFNGTVDPSTIQTDPNSDWVFQDTGGVNQFSCGGSECTQDELNGFVNSVVGNDPALVYGQGANDGVIDSGLSFVQTVEWFNSRGFSQYPEEKWGDPWHAGELNLRDPSPFCSTHVTLNPKSGQTPGQPTTGEFHVDTANPWSDVNAFPPAPFRPPGGVVQAVAHLFADVIPGLGHFKTSSKVCQ